MISVEVDQSDDKLLALSKAKKSLKQTMISKINDLGGKMNPKTFISLMRYSDLFVNQVV